MHPPEAYIVKAKIRATASEPVGTVKVELQQLQIWAAADQSLSVTFGHTTLEVCPTPRDVSQLCNATSSWWFA